MTDTSQTPQDADDTQDPGFHGGPAPAADGAPSTVEGAAPTEEEARAADPLEEEGDIAADYLEELLDTADLDGDIDIEVRDGRTYLSVVAEDEDGDSLSVLIGEDGEVLEALQELLRLSVLAATDRRSRLVLDIAGYRRQRATQLQEMAGRAAREARETRQRVHLEPLSAYERKIVHDVVAENGLVSESEGEGAARHIVVSVPED